MFEYVADFFAVVMAEGAEAAAGQPNSKTLFSKKEKTGVFLLLRRCGECQLALGAVYVSHLAFIFLDFDPYLFYMCRKNLTPLPLSAQRLVILMLPSLISILLPCRQAVQEKKRVI